MSISRKPPTRPVVFDIQYQFRLTPQLIHFLGVKKSTSKDAEMVRNALWEAVRIHRFYPDRPFITLAKSENSDHRSNPPGWNKKRTQFNFCVNKELDEAITSLAKPDEKRNQTIKRLLVALAAFNGYYRIADERDRLLPRDRVIPDYESYYNN